ncbi:polyketide synthase 2 [Aspergillus carlsbadensis]|nr:polyketide synthase 2 [Aspergillus carlsbadensis]
MPEHVAIVGFACRLPGGNSNPQKLWDFLERGEIADNSVPETRFNFDGHYDGSLKPGTMRQAGGMFLTNIDPADFDAGFFEVGGVEATAMDPNQRQMLEVVFESLENAGIPMEKISNRLVGCYVGSYAADYADMASRDPADRPVGSSLGIAPTLLANRLSHFFNIKGPSITVDTACSGSLIGLDMACQALRVGTVEMAIVAAANLYLSPEHLIDGTEGAYSPTALCHTFSAKADGYVKAEGVSSVILKRLSDAVRDRDPIRGVILGTASNHNGRTAGIASPNAEAQALAIRAAYTSAGIMDFNQTAYLECHGTGTKAGDATEVKGAAAVFSPTRDPAFPLIIGSIKSNIGHSEPAAGLSGLIKVAMAIEKGLIPGNPTFVDPNPQIDFAGSKVRASRQLIEWPEGARRRASVNSFGIGGANAHAIIEQACPRDHTNHVSSYLALGDESMFEEEEHSNPTLFNLVVSADNATSLRANITALCTHLLNPRVQVNLADLAHTLSERRTHHFHRAFITASDTDFSENDFTLGKKTPQPPKIALVFTGQGAQWPQMGKQLLETFPWTREILEELDRVLQAQPDPPMWSLLSELTDPRTPEHMRQPEISQPLVTALQLCLLAVLESWGVRATCVVGHSSGECAAAYVAGLLDRAGALKAAFYRGRAVANCVGTKKVDAYLGMLAVGLGPENAASFLQDHVGDASIACFNSPSSVTISGKKAALELICEKVKAVGHFARLLQVDMAYHSRFMGVIGDEYLRLLDKDTAFGTLDGSSSGVAMYSSVTGLEQTTPADPRYWRENMVSPVKFGDALREMMVKESPTHLIEIGAAGALAGPISQVLKSLPDGGESVAYRASWTRSDNAVKSLLKVAGALFISGAPIDMARVNDYSDKVRTIIDLPNYSWNHTTKYWHESAASRDWRFRKFPVHDLLGSKVLSTSWHRPVWRNRLDVTNIPWILDHRMGGNAIMPAAGFMAMAVEALYQKHSSIHKRSPPIAANHLSYQFRNVRFMRALVLEEGKAIHLMVTLHNTPGSKEWHEFQASTTSNDDTLVEHCTGRIRIHEPTEEVPTDISPLQYPQSPKRWYKANRQTGLDFGPAFQRLLAVECTAGERTCRAEISLTAPDSKWSPQSYYPMHPVALDGCLQALIPPNSAGECANVRRVMIPALIDEVIISKVPAQLSKGLASASSVYSGRGRVEAEKSWIASMSLHDVQTGSLLVRISGVHYVELDMPKKADPHTFLRGVWRPDIALLDRGQLSELYPVDGLQRAIDLLAHKTPGLKVLEISLDEGDTSSLWFDTEDSASILIRSAYARYDIGIVYSEALVTMQTKYQHKRDTSVVLLRPADSELGLSPEVSYDLAIIKTRRGDDSLTALINRLRQVLQPHASVVVVKLPVTDDGSSPSGSCASSSNAEHAVMTAPFTPGDLSLRDNTERSKDTHSLVPNQGSYQGLPDYPLWPESIVEIPPSRINEPSYIITSSGAVSTPQPQQQLMIARLDKHNHQALSPSLHQTLTASGWNVTHEDYPFPQPPPGTVVLVLDELVSPILRYTTEEQWEGIKVLVTLSSSSPLLWVTAGAQHPSTNPDAGLVHGLFRVARREDNSLNLMTLDVQTGTGRAAELAIERVLRLLRARNESNSGLRSIECEYMERDGVIHIQRLVPDEMINDFKRSEDEGCNVALKSLSNSGSAQVQLRAERLGTVEGLTWCETDLDKSPLKDTEVEIEIMAAGVNFKDVAIHMGLVPDNEYSLGVECAGVVRRVGREVARVNVGDRVCTLAPGAFANWGRFAADRCHVIPESMSYEEAAAIPSVYVCALYSLYHLAGLREGQSVLIHSAAGGVGLACIELARHRKAEIFVTVGTDEKLEFLMGTYKIPPTHIFSSRNSHFTHGILRETGGRGVDVVINSLVGELLDASWRIVADGGTMVEIGKRDILDRNSLSMEPFDRNCSFRAVDVSFLKHFNDALVAKVLDEVFTLLSEGCIRPIHPITRFRFDAVPEALAQIRAGRHIGKLVISRRDDEPDVMVSVRPAVRKLHLRPDVSYLIVGGLRGACGTLAIHMAQCGARNIVVCSRSGIADERSAKIRNDCLAYECKAVEARVDVGDLAATRQVFQSTVPRIAGIIQGAMVLRDKPYETMTHDDYHTTLHAKVQGTWNLHHASLDLPAPLDFFTMLSSISGVIGNGGQANYASANTFLDTFASYRQSLGLAANAIDLGPLEDVGYIADEDTGALGAKFNSALFVSLDERMLRRVLAHSILNQESALLSDSTQFITGLAYPLPEQAAGSLAQDSQFSYLTAAATATATKNAVNMQDHPDNSDKVEPALRALQTIIASGADSATVSKACVAALSSQFAKILRLVAEDVEPGKSLMAYGVDSLSAVELRNWIRAKMRVEVTTLDVVNASSLVELGNKVVSKMLAADA